MGRGMRCDGLETRFLRHLPEVLLAGVVPGAAIAAATDDGMALILVLAFMLAWVMALVPAALAALVICAMKGRERTADSYRLP